MSKGDRLSVEVAGIVFGIRVPAQAWRARVAGRYADFVSTAPPAWRVEVAWEPSVADPEQPYIRLEGSEATFHVPGLRGRVDLARSHARAEVPSEEWVGSALDRMLTYICMEALPRQRAGLLLHAAGIAWDGVGYAFFGPSGAGKTTLAQLAVGRAEVLADENIIVRAGPAGRDWELISTPFWGASTPRELVQRVNRRVPLRALFALAHAPSFGLTRLSPGEAVMTLLATEKVAVGSGESAAAWLTTAGRLVEKVPVYRLEFRPTAEVWDFLTRAVHLP